MPRFPDGAVRHLPNFEEDCPSQEESSHADWQEWCDGPPRLEDYELPVARTPGPSSSAVPAVVHTPPPPSQRRTRLRRNWAEAGYTEVELGGSCNPATDAAEAEAGGSREVHGEAGGSEADELLETEGEEKAYKTKWRVYNLARNGWCKQWLEQKNSQPNFWSKGASYMFKREAARKAWQNLPQMEKTEALASFDSSMLIGEHRNDRRYTKDGGTAQRVFGQLHTYNYPLMDIPFLYDAIKTMKEADVESVEFKEAITKVAAHPTVLQMWEEWKTKYKELCVFFPDVVEVSMCGEVSLHSRGDETGLRVHFHGAISSLKQGQIPKYDWADWEINDVCPDVQNTNGRGRYATQAVERMHMYVQVSKLGHLFTDTNFPMYFSFRVEPKWLMQLWQERKLDTETVKDCFLECRRNCCGQFKFLEFYENAMTERKARRAQRVAQKALARTLKRFKTYPKITLFLEQHLDTNFGKLRRFLFLVLEGPSSVGKTVLAKSFYGDEHTYYYNMQTAKEPDLRGFRYGYHKALLLDEISWQQVIRLKVLFQAGVDGVDLGASQCNQFAYWRYLYGVAIICCTNQWLPPKEDEQADRRTRSSASHQIPEESAEEEVCFRGMHYEPVPPADREWLETNSIYQEITAPTWYED